MRLLYVLTLLICLLACSKQKYPVLDAGFASGTNYGFLNFYAGDTLVVHYGITTDRNPEDIVIKFHDLPDGIDKHFAYVGATTDQNHEQVLLFDCTYVRNGKWVDKDYFKIYFTTKFGGLSEIIHELETRKYTKKNILPQPFYSLSDTTVYFTTFGSYYSRYYQNQTLLGDGPSEDGKYIMERLGAVEYFQTYDEIKDVKMIIHENNGDVTIPEQDLLTKYGNTIKHFKGSGRVYFENKQSNALKGKLIYSFQYENKDYEGRAQIR